MPKPIQEVWSNPESFTTTLLVVFLDRYGTEGLKWDPATIAMEVEDDFGVSLSQEIFDRLIAGIQLLTTNDFYVSLPTFITLCNVLSGDTYNPNLWDPADSLEIAWGITEAILLSPPEAGEDEPFSDEIRAYIGFTLDQEGIMNPPDLLRLAIRSSQVMLQADYSDDPTMFGAIYEAEQQKTDEINQIIRKRLATLSDQLVRLPLRTGDARDVIRNLFNASSS
jgi:hypothetical protein